MALSNCHRLWTWCYIANEKVCVAWWWTHNQEIVDLTSTSSLSCDIGQGVHSVSPLSSTEAP